jgi:hypothetical protein
MKNNLLKTCCCLLLLLFASCNLNKKETSSLFSIDVEGNINKMEIINLSQFADNIRYVPLDNSEKFPLVGLNHIEISDNLILVDNGNMCLLYDSEGHFISKIGNKGRGPGEYQYLRNIGLSFDKNLIIYIYTYTDILEFNLDGSHINTYKNSLRIDQIDEYCTLQSVCIINDTLFFGQVPNEVGNAKYKAIVINKFGKIKHSYNNYNIITREIGASKVFEGFAYISKFNGMLYFKEQFNDTLFKLNKDYELIPQFCFNLGKFKMPDSERVLRPIGPLLASHVHIYDIFQTKNYLFLKCDLGNRFPAKRLTPSQPLFPGTPQFMYNTTCIWGVYDKSSGNLTFSQPTSTDNKLYTSGIYNDIDCGPRFSPKQMINDSTMLMSVRADELKNHVESDDFKNSIANYPKKKKQLKELADKISVLDNPILMFVTFKK